MLQRRIHDRFITMPFCWRFVSLAFRALTWPGVYFKKKLWQRLGVFLKGWIFLKMVLLFQEYVDAHGIKGFFKDSQFLVFVNRILAFILASCYILLRRQGRHTAPLYKYAYCSFSNILSSWCQYEALKYVSFPTQVFFFSFFFYVFPQFFSQTSILPKLWNEIFSWKNSCTIFFTQSFFNKIFLKSFSY